MTFSDLYEHSFKVAEIKNFLQVLHFHLCYTEFILNIFSWLLLLIVEGEYLLSLVFIS